MKELKHYSEEDFQNYFDKCFSGDTNSLENHLLECELCNKKFNAYSLVWSFARNDLQTEPLKINLAYAVANKVFAVKESKGTLEKFLYTIFICSVIACASLCLNFLIARSIPVPFLLLAVPLGLYLWLNYKENKIVEQKFASYLR